MPKAYMSRIVDGKLKALLESSGAVLIAGAKWCGKTTTGSQLAASIINMHDPQRRQQYIQLAAISPSTLLAGPTPMLIDEWQVSPELWDAVRFEVDQRGSMGQFIMTGSAVPADKARILHTGTGRICRLLMRPMSLFESGDSDGSVSLAALFNGESPQAQANPSLEQLAFLICRGGWPATVGLPQSTALQTAQNYYEAVTESDIARAAGVPENAARAKRVMRAYARSTASQASFSSLSDDILAHDADGFTAKTLSAYISALRNIFVIEDSPAWNVNLRSKTAMRTSDTHYLADPSIAAASLGAGPGDLISDLRTMGLLFENLCVRDLRVYADALDGQIFHYRDRNGLECDAVLHRKNGSYGLIEIKLGANEVDAAAENLKKLRDKIDTSCRPAPSFLMVLTGMSLFAYQRKDGVCVVPVTCLKP